MQSDSLMSARRVRQPIESKDDIINAFDSITYDKGSALLNMFESFMGRERFRAGIHRYLTKYSWKNATSAEFLAALAGDDTSVAAAFSTFLDQPGVPLVTAALDCSGGTAKLKLSQQRFLPLGSVGSADQTWQIPVCARYPSGQGDARECALLSQKSAQLALSRSRGCPAWVEANAGAAGYYFGLYEGNLLNALLKDDAQVLTLPEKVALVGNLSSLTSNGKLPLGRALAVAPSLAQDPDRQVVTKTMEITTGLQDNLVSERPAAPLPAVSLGRLWRTSSRPGLEDEGGRERRCPPPPPCASPRACQSGSGLGVDRSSQETGTGLARRS